MSLTSDIREYALSIGFAKVGITTAEDFTDFEEELQSRGTLFDPWKGKFSIGTKPKKMLSSGKSIIVLAYDYGQVDYPPKLLQYLGRLYLARCYGPLPASMAGARLGLFEGFLEKNNCGFSPDKNTLPLRWAAARAGVTNFGRNNFAYVNGVGSFLMLYAYIIDKELEYDEPTMDNKCPEGCRKCVDACPTKAIYAPFRLDPSKCISFNNWMRKVEGHERLDTTVPLDIRKEIGVRIHGCDKCQEVCPRNKGKVEGKFPKDPFLELLKDQINLSDILLMTDEYYQRWVHPIMYNYIKDKKIFQRNAAIAIGNTGDDRYIPNLEQALSNPAETVRRHVAWALGRIGGGKARSILENHWAKEPSEAVKEEISLALDNLS